VIERAFDGRIALLDPTAFEFIPDAGAGRLHDHPRLFRQGLVLHRQPDMLGNLLDHLQGGRTSSPMLRIVRARAMLTLV
jgi:hypothetical protein